MRNRDLRWASCLADQPRSAVGSRHGPGRVTAKNSSAAVSTVQTVGEGALGEAHNPPLIRNGVRAVAETLPHARRRTLAGQTHDISPEATAPVLAEFLSATLRKVS